MESRETPRLVTVALASVDEFQQQCLAALHALADPPLRLALEADFVMPLAVGLESHVPILLAPPMLLEDVNAVESALDAWRQAMADWVQQNAVNTSGQLSVNLRVLTLDEAIESGACNFSIAINR